MKCLYSTCGIYRLGEHCKIIGKRFQNHVKYSAIQTIHAHHQTSIKIWSSVFPVLFPLADFMASLLSSHACSCTGQESTSWVWYAPAPYPSPTPQQIMNPSQWTSAEIRVGHTERSTSEFSHHTVFFLLKLYFKKQSVVNARTAPASHTLASSSRLTETPYTGIESHPWTNLKTNSVRVLNNAQKLWGPSSLQGVVNTVHMVRSLDKICIRSKLQTVGILQPGRWQRTLCSKAAFRLMCVQPSKYTLSRSSRFWQRWVERPQCIAFP